MIKHHEQSLPTMNHQPTKSAAICIIQPLLGSAHVFQTSSRRLAHQCARHRSNRRTSPIRCSLGKLLNHSCPKEIGLAMWFYWTRGVDEAENSQMFVEAAMPFLLQPKPQSDFGKRTSQPIEGISAWVKLRGGPSQIGRAHV